MAIALWRALASGQEKFVSGAAGCILGLAAFAAPAAATTACTSTALECAATLDTISGTGIGSGSQGTVTLTEQGSDSVLVEVALTSGVLLVNTGGPHTPFVFNLSSSLTNPVVAIDQTDSNATPASFFVQSGSQMETPYGTFQDAIGYYGTQGGVGHGNPGPLFFTVTVNPTSNPNGINLSDFVGNGGGYFFAADVLGTGGGTGGVAAGAPVCIAGPDCRSNSLGTPLPPAMPLLIGGLGLIGLLSRRKKRYPGSTSDY